MAAGMKSLLMDKINKNRISEREINSRLKDSLLPKERLDWITDDKRQITWLLAYLRTKFGHLPINLIPPRLLGRLLLIANIDILNISLKEKSYEIEKMERNWNKHKQSDYIFKWFKDKDELSRCELAWSWLQEKKGSRRFSREVSANYENLLNFYDKEEMSDAEKKLDVIAIKKRWSQQQYRKKNSGKKQCNLLLSTQALANLDKLSIKYDLSKSQIFETLIRLEAEQSAYLPQKRE